MPLTEVTRRSSGLDAAEVADDIGPAVRKIGPSSDRYWRLKDKLAEYRKMQREGGWPKIPQGKTLEPGATSDRMKAKAENFWFYPRVTKEKYQMATMLRGPTLMEIG